MPELEPTINFLLPGEILREYDNPDFVVRYRQRDRHLREEDRENPNYSFLNSNPDKPKMNIN
jgi:hypothetical protein